MSTECVVTFVVPTHDDAHFLPECLSSIAASLNSRHEVVVVNDHTTDVLSESVLRRIGPAASHQILRVISSVASGLASARNSGVAEAEGTWIRFLDADDLLVSGSTEVLLESVAGPYSVSIGAVRCVDLSTGEARELLCPPDDFPTYSVSDLLRAWERTVSIPIHAALFPAGLFSSSNRWFMESLTSKEDFVFWARLLAHPVTIKVLPTVVGVYRVRSDSLSRANPEVNGLAFLAAVKAIQTGIEGNTSEEDLASLWSYFCEVYGPHLSGHGWMAASQLAEELLGLTGIDGTIESALSRSNDERDACMAWSSESQGHGERGKRRG